ncbi:BAG family molecular chaperone regulator 6 [Physcomitrium patens]|uniref:BAG domain-containing protein n=1 Tax=Physcomitrium patens TaxID=3218 RepID=A0A2K1IQY7_PHYPA|nr:BAG family molecular chaperone regulator 6-like [Physcomitrium patens]XP_024359925.1 BAG family molecular chaperone regulator 6-like [Physcomitrium patens]XP_024359926.1 BAG family molecular chaperone regulator 6-like [Physcomitrium patens]XP_024359927.1 BAG family molecular chaperone regulator 6-like [Physcomitrium patens]XP_024359928.1 BAG family molecular chaperone regulator 6-like [Physcomitrium patens]PNR31693.1 hypothetical protein PHYPA_025815 [Physcomitrium patens]|eukprot:XP_024359924.1 BAG family molecular chaperone regulator 6-like [Physcomitrella patens]
MSGRNSALEAPASTVLAATIIQAHWRGSVLRRTSPLEKLQIIHQVRQDLKDHIQVLADAAQFEKLCADPKERLRWSECAMTLLLRLDSIQGAHAYVRDVRKVTSKEVIAFQEIIDSTAKDASSDVIRRALKSTLTMFRNMDHILER